MSSPPPPGDRPPGRPPQDPGEGRTRPEPFGTEQPAAPGPISTSYYTTLADEQDARARQEMRTSLVSGRHPRQDGAHSLRSGHGVGRSEALGQERGRDAQGERNFREGVAGEDDGTTVRARRMQATFMDDESSYGTLGERTPGLDADSGAGIGSGAGVRLIIKAN